MELPAVFYPLTSAVLTAVVYVMIEILAASGFSEGYLASTFGLVGGALLLFSMGPKLLSDSLKKLSKGNLPILLLLVSFFAFAFSRLLEVTAIKMIGASKISFLAQLEAPFVLVLSALILKERPGWKKLLYGSLIIAGALITNFRGWMKFSLGSEDIIGMVFPAGYAIAVILLAYLINSKKIDVRAVTGCSMVLGSLMILVFLLGETTRPAPPGEMATAPVILLAGGLLVGLYWLAYNTGLKIAGASVTAMVYASTPVFTFLLSSIAAPFFLGKVLIPGNMGVFLAGAVLILAGTFLLAKAEKGKAA